MRRKILNYNRYYTHLLLLDIRLIVRDSSSITIIALGLLYAFLLGILHHQLNILLQVEFLIVFMFWNLESYFTSINRSPNEIKWYIISGVDLLYVFLSKNTALLIVTFIGTLFFISVFSIITDSSWQAVFQGGFYFSSSIFPLLMFGNYVFVFQRKFGVSSERVPWRRIILHNLSLLIASIPFIVSWWILRSYILCVLVSCALFLLWYLSTTRHIAKLAYDRLFELVEIS